MSEVSGITAPASSTLPALLAHPAAVEQIAVEKPIAKMDDDEWAQVEAEEKKKYDKLQFNWYEATIDIIEAVYKASGLPIPTLTHMKKVVNKLDGSEQFDRGVMNLAKAFGLHSAEDCEALAIANAKQCFRCEILNGYSSATV